MVWENVDEAQKNLTVMIIHLLRAETRMKEKEGIKGRGAAAYVASAQAVPPQTKEQREAMRKEINNKKKTIVCWNCGEVGHWT